MNPAPQKKHKKGPAEDEIREVCNKLADFLVAKNRKYGNAALEPINCFSKASAGEQINVRLDDKISRIMSQQEDEDEDVKWDLLGYLVLDQVGMLLQAKKEQTLAPLQPQPFRGELPPEDIRVASPEERGRRIDR